MAGSRAEYEKLLWDICNSPPITYGDIDLPKLPILLKDRILVHLYSKDLETCITKLIHTKRLRISTREYVNLKDENEKTALYYAITNGLPNCVKILLENGAELTPSEDSSDETDISLATKLALEMPDVLKDVFDKSVTVAENDEGKTQLRLDWRPIVQYREVRTQGDHEHLTKVSYEPGPNQKETEFLYSLLLGTHKIRSKLLMHPLVAAFVHLKEEHVKTQLKILYFLMLCFPLIYMGFVYNLYFVVCKYQGSNSTQTNDDESVGNDEEAPDNFCKITVGISMFAYIMSVFVAGWAFIKIYMLRFGVDTYYFKSWRTWLSSFALGVIALTLWPALHTGSTYDMDKHSFQYPIASIGIFFSWVMFLLQVGNLPRVSTYLEVLAKVILSVLRIYILFMPLLIGFYMGFMLMFDFEKSFVFRYIIMTADIGTAEYEDLIKDTKDNYFWFSGMGYTFCVCFIVIIVIVFMNFVLGESINDIQQLKKKAASSRVSKRIQNLFVVDMFDRVPSFKCRLITLEELKINKWYDDYDTFDKVSRKERRKNKSKKMDKTSKIPFEIQEELLKIATDQELKMQDGGISLTKEKSYSINTAVDNDMMNHQQLQRRLADFELKIDEINKKLDALNE